MSYYNVYSCEREPSAFTLIGDGKLPMPKDGYNYMWYIENFTPDLPKEQLIHFFTEAFLMWQHGMDDVFPKGPFISFLRTEERAKADIIISFREKFHIYTTSEGETHQCLSAFDDVGGVLAHARALNSNLPDAGQIHLDERENWSEYMRRENGKLYVDVLTTLAHEIGHVLCVGHSKVKGALMGRTHTGVKKRLHRDDKLALSATAQEVKMQIAKKQGWEPEIDETPTPLPKRLTWWEKIIIKIFR